MTSFWPDGIQLSDLQSPMEILQEAQREWKLTSNGIMDLVLQPAKSTSGNDMVFVHAKHLPSNRTASLFAVVYRPANPYPVTIQPRDDELPDVLKKTYYKPGVDPFRTFTSISVIKTDGRTVTNHWVSDTPSEFRTKLHEVFNLGIVKSELLNLACKNSQPNGDEPDGDSIVKEG